MLKILRGLAQQGDLLCLRANERHNKQSIDTRAHPRTASQVWLYSAQ
jgi:hypothetical protein